MNRIKLFTCKCFGRIWLVNLFLFMLMKTRLNTCFYLALHMHSVPVILGCRSLSWFCMMYIVGTGQISKRKCFIKRNTTKLLCSDIFSASFQDGFCLFIISKRRQRKLYFSGDEFKGKVKGEVSCEMAHKTVFSQMLFHWSISVPSFRVDKYVISIYS